MYPVLKPPGDAPDVGLLQDLAARREFAMLPRVTSAAVFPQLQLHGGQQFLRALGAPQTPYSRIAVLWPPGVGKSIAALVVAQALLAALRHRSVTIVSFYAQETLLAELMSRPEFGFATPAEAAEWRRLRGATDAASRQRFATLKKQLRRRIREGGYRVFGYKEFAAQMFTVTARGREAGVSLLPKQAEQLSSVASAMASLVAEGLVEVNWRFLDALRGGGLICDEAHIMYNLQRDNNYGVAIQYALSALGDDAPRALFITATPMKGSTREGVDFLNLLVPRAVPLRATDLFDAAGELLPGALERIAAMAVGRVSFMRDPDVASYPRREFVGESVPGVQYLRLQLCPVSPLHAEACRLQRDARDSGDSAAAPAVFDAAFPAPDDQPLFRRDMFVQLRAAPAAWRAAQGIEVLDGVADGLPAGEVNVGGPCLRLRDASAPAAQLRLEEVSAKYAAMMRIVRDALAQPGKVMIYHQRVTKTGVLMARGVLEANGIIAEDRPPAENTRCTLCGAEMRAHDAAGHTFVPARYCLVHSKIDRFERDRIFGRFNAPDNLHGERIRVFVGSKAVREAHSLVAVRTQIILALPDDISTLIQVFGRVVRKNSHRALPPDARLVRTHILVSVWEGDEPEIGRYKTKMAEFVRIQEIERALRQYAADSFLATPLTEAALEGLPYQPAVAPREPQPAPAASSFYAYGFAAHEVSACAMQLRLLFAQQAVWHERDILQAARAAQFGVTYRVDAASDGAFALALRELAKPFESGAGEMLAVSYRAPFFIASRGALDFESYLRGPATVGRLEIDVGAHTQTEQRARIFAVRLHHFDIKYNARQASPIEFALVNEPADFHVQLLRALVEDAPAVGRLDAALRERTVAMYESFRILFRAGDVAAPNAFLSREGVQRYDGKNWHVENAEAFGIGARLRENDIVVGFVEDAHTAKFKLRPPRQLVRSHRDARRLPRGAVCEIRSRPFLANLLRQLKVPQVAATVTAVCDQLRSALLARERDARRDMRSGVRWLYLFHDPPGALAARLK